MCTVSIISTGTADHPGIRLACNRDELRTRPAALPPQRRRFGEYEAVLPIDPASGGTWITLSDAGFAAVLLNRTFASMPVPDPSDSRSRGLIIPSLLHATELDEAFELARRIDPPQFQPFRLLIVSTDAVASVESDGRALRESRDPMGTTPRMFTSSGLGDELVQQPRRELFERMLVRSGATPGQQDAFHAHRWPERAHLSVNMSRVEARTVSRTTIELSPAGASLRYAAV